MHPGYLGSVLPHITCLHVCQESNMLGLRFRFQPDALAKAVDNEETNELLQRFISLALLRRHYVMK